MIDPRLGPVTNSPTPITIAAKGARPDPSRFCPNCSSEMLDHRCKLKCPKCEFYLSCSDFY